MERQTCYRCDLLVGAVIIGVERHVKLVGNRGLAELRQIAEAVAEFDLLIAGIVPDPAQ
jgi:hypothetical protein